MGLEEALPIRQATRLINEFQLRVGSIGLEVAGLDMTRTLTLLTVYRTACRAPADTRISVNGMATSLKQPVETVRRAAHALADMGFCQRSERGVRRAPGFLRLPPIVRAGDDLLAAFAAMLDGLERSGLPLPSSVRDRERGHMLAAALDIYLSAFELTESRIGQPIVLYVLGTITVLNAAGITHDPVLSARYGVDETVPPDALRRPATVREIADFDGLPVTTVWRHATALERAGAIRRTPEGYLLSDTYMRNPVTSERSREKVAYVRRVLQDLAEGTKSRCPDQA